MSLPPIPFGKPILGSQERDLIEEVLQSGQLVHSAITQRFEEAFAAFVGDGEAVSVSSATAAMHLGLFTAGIGQGDAAIVLALTHPATAHAVELTDARAVFVDVDPKTGNLDTSLLERAADFCRQHDLHLKAILPVHYLGLPVDMDALTAFSRTHNLMVLEDCALALGSFWEGTHAGLLGDAGCFSFYPAKYMTSVEGGMFLTRDPKRAELVRACRAFGYDKALGNRAKPGIYDVDRLGFNYRMNEIEAAVGMAQLERLPGFLKARRHNDDTLRDALSSLITGTLGSRIHIPPATQGKGTSGRYCLNVILDETRCPPRDDVADRLKADGIGYSIHYPGPVPHFRYYQQKYETQRGQFPVAERWSAQLLSLPVGPHLQEGDVQRIAQGLIKAIDQRGWDTQHTSFNTQHYRISHGS